MKTLTIALLLLTQSSALSPNPTPNRRTMLTSAFTSTSAAFIASNIAIARPESAQAVQMYNTSKGVKYAITKDLPQKSKLTYPQPGDFVAVEYTGYKVDGSIFDATHAQGKSNALLFKLGSGSVIPGLDDIVSQMAVGQKVQAIISPDLAYGDKGVCLENGECLIKSGETLVYDVVLKKTSIPPP